MTFLQGQSDILKVKPLNIDLPQNQKIRSLTLSAYHHDTDLLSSPVDIAPGHSYAKFVLQYITMAQIGKLDCRLNKGN